MECKIVNTLSCLSNLTWVDLGLGILATTGFALLAGMLFALIKVIVYTRDLD